jgi:hypothetical protein
VRLLGTGAAALTRGSAVGPGGSGTARRGASGSVSRWARELQRGGERTLKKAGRARRRPSLRVEDLRRIKRGLKRGPQALGY